MSLPAYDWLRERMETEEGRANIRKATELGGIAKELGIPLAQMAIAWCLKNRNVSTVILGADERGAAAAESCERREEGAAHRRGDGDDRGRAGEPAGASDSVLRRVVLDDHARSDPEPVGVDGALEAAPFAEDDLRAGERAASRGRRRAAEWSAAPFCITVSSTLRVVALSVSRIANSAPGCTTSLRATRTETEVDPFVAGGVESVEPDESTLAERQRLHGVGTARQHQLRPRLDVHLAVAARLEIGGVDRVAQRDHTNVPPLLQHAAQRRRLGEERRERFHLGGLVGPARPGRVDVGAGRPEGQEPERQSEDDATEHAAKVRTPDEISIAN